MMGPLAAIRSVLTQYATFSGRAPRAEYWWFTLFAIAGGVVAGMIDMAVFGFVRIGPTSILPFTDGLALALFVPGIAVSVRRLHDVGLGGAFWVSLIILLQLYSLGSAYLDQDVRTGGFSLALALVVLGVVAVLLIQYIRPSQPGPNRFGPPPYDEALPDAEVFR
ncbi:MAG: DUF805 domain-containing protein [Paracoccus sp. (in: a-proteobacteria)]|nr:DUF805 domain-containing protein [Paracoccus sp. (in: a-proteobacteria)]